MSLSSLQKPDDPEAGPGPARADRRLSVLEVCVLAIGLVCLCLVVVKTVQDQRNQTQAGRLASAAEAVSVWVEKAHLARKDGSGLQPIRCNADQNTTERLVQTSLAFVSQKPIFSRFTVKDRSLATVSVFTTIRPAQFRGRSR